MLELSLERLAEVVEGQLFGPPEALVTAQVVTDSRQASIGSLFVAIAGERVDGHDYVTQALDLGAVVSLVERAVPGNHVLVTDTVRALGKLAQYVLATLRSSAELQVIGVTGSVGKTTTKDLLAQILSQVGPTVWPPDSFNNEIGLPMTVLQATSQTRFLVLELGASGPGHIAELVQIAPLDVAAVLKVGQAHLGGFGSVRAVAEAKAEIFSGLTPQGQAVINGDDLRVAEMDTGGHRRWSFGTNPANLVQASGIGQNSEGNLTCQIHFADQALPVTTTLVGEHQVHNVLAAITMALAVGVDFEQAVAGVNQAQVLSPHRMAVHQLPGEITLIDDSYNANPDSMRAALRALADHATKHGGRSVAVLGEMRELGAASLEAHDLIGRLAVRLNISWLIVVGAGARAISTAAQHEGSWGDEVDFVPDLAAAKTLLDDNLKPGDTLLLKASNGAGLWRLADDLIQAGAAK